VPVDPGDRLGQWPRSSHQCRRGAVPGPPVARPRASDGRSRPAARSAADRGSSIRDFREPRVNVLKLNLALDGVDRSMSGHNSEHVRPDPDRPWRRSQAERLGRHAQAEDLPGTPRCSKTYCMLEAATSGGTGRGCGGCLRGNPRAPRNRSGCCGLEVVTRKQCPTADFIARDGCRCRLVAPASAFPGGRAGPHQTPWIAPSKRYLDVEELLCEALTYMPL